MLNVWIFQPRPFGHSVSELASTETWKDVNPGAIFTCLEPPPDVG